MPKKSPVDTGPMPENPPPYRITFAGETWTVTPGFRAKVSLAMIHKDEPWTYRGVEYKVSLSVILHPTGIRTARCVPLDKTARRVTREERDELWPMWMRVAAEAAINIP